MIMNSYLPGVFGNIDASPGEDDIAFPLFPTQVVNGKLEFRR